MNIISSFTLSDTKRNRRSISAFTLAEVLITLGIIGVVAAMTLPTVIKFYNIKSTEASLKNTYSTLQQIIKLSEANDVSVTLFNGNHYLSLQNWFNDYVSKNLKVTKSCTENENGCWHSYNVVKDLNKNNAWDESANGMIGNYPFAFIDLQGRMYNMDVSGSSTIANVFGVNVPSGEYSMEIFFDVNGQNKPNIIGKDIYIVIWAEDKGLIPAGYDKTSDNVKENCINGNGYLCLSYVIQNNWKIDKRVWDRK